MRKKLRVLMASNVDASGEGNLFEFQLLCSLAATHGIHSVQHGTGWIHVADAAFDVIHFQWPEGLTHFCEPTDEELSAMERVLNARKENSVMVATVHNLYPHYRDTDRFRQLYELVYEKMDGIVHMGNQSFEGMKKRYPDIFNWGNGTVIPHGNYKFLPNVISRGEARTLLGIHEKDRVLLCFGELRNAEEVDTIIDAFDQLKVRSKLLLIVGRLPHGARSRPMHYVTRIPLWCRKRVKIIETRVPSKEVQNYLNACDVVVIPRKRALNSGNVALGYTFGKVVVGTDVGVIGESLKQTGNPTFDPNHPETLVRAIEEALEKEEAGDGEKNRRYAEKELDWKSIAERYKDFYLGAGEKSGKL